MAHLEPIGLDALEKLSSGMSRVASDIDEIAKRCVEAGNPVMEAIYRNTMSGANSSLSKAAAATNTTKAKKNHLGVYSVSRAVGWNPSTRTKYASFHDWESQHKTRYGMIAALFNYGVGAHRVDFSGNNAYHHSSFVSHGRPMHPGMSVNAKGWHGKAAKAAEGPVSKVVSKAFDSEMKNLLK